MRGCAVKGCKRPHHGHGWCRLHLGRWTTHGDPLTRLGPHDTRVRLPMDPLLHEIGSDTHLGAAKRLAARCGGRVESWHRSILRWVKNGIPRASAERITETLGVHPMELWPEFERVKSQQSTAISESKGFLSVSSP
jgi:hypothetical protein